MSLFLAIVLAVPGIVPGSPLLRRWSRVVVRARWSPPPGAWR